MTRSQKDQEATWKALPLRSPQALPTASPGSSLSALREGSNHPRPQPLGYLPQCLTRNLNSCHVLHGPARPAPAAGPRAGPRCLVYGTRAAGRTSELFPRAGPLHVLPSLPGQLHCICGSAASDSPTRILESAHSTVLPLHSTSADLKFHSRVRVCLVNP